MSYDFTAAETDRVDFGGNAAWRIIGDLTIRVFAKFQALTAGSFENVLLSCGAAGELEADNFNYMLYLDNSGTFTLFWEYSTGTNESASSSASASITLDTWYEIVVTRDVANNEVRFWFDGTELGTAQSFTNDPTGGGNATLEIGWDVNATDNGADAWIGEIAIWDVELTDAQIETELAGGTHPEDVNSTDLVFNASLRRDAIDRVQNVAGTATGASLDEADHPTKVISGNVKLDGANYQNANVIVYNTSMDELEGSDTTDSSGNWNLAVRMRDTYHVAAGLRQQNSIAAVTTGTAGNASFGVAGDVTGNVVAGRKIEVKGSTGNDSVYTISGSSFSNPNTTIDVDEAVNNSTADGTIHGIVVNNVESLPHIFA